MMDLDQLQSVRDRERQTDKLQQLRESFYADAADLIADLREERDSAAEEAADPFDDPRVSRLTDQINTAEQTVEAIYEKRVGKLVKAASFAAADLPAETEGMTAEEQDLFDALVADIRANRQRVLDVLAGEEGDAAAGSGPQQSAAAGGVDAASLMGGDSGGGEESADAGTTGGDGEAAAAGPQSGDTGSDSEDRHPPPPSQRPPEDRDGEPDEQPAPTGTDAQDAPDARVDRGDDAGREVDDREGEACGENSGDRSAVGSDDREESGGDEPGAPSSTADPGTPRSVAESEEGGAEPGESEGSDPDAVDRTTVRITADVGEIFGVDDREYHLERDDVVTLPAANAEPLLEQDAAERID